MTNRSLVALIALILMSLARTASAGEIPIVKPEQAGMSSEKLAKVDIQMNDLVVQKKLAGGSVIVARRGKIVHLRSYGLMDVESNKPMRDDAIVRIYSMTKAIATAAALVLHDKGKLGLDDPVSKFIPELKELKVAGKDGDVSAKNPMTIRHLMLHVAGLSYGNSGNAASDKVFKEAKLFDPFNLENDLAAFSLKLSQVPLAYEPGTDWSYGIAIDVLGRVIEVVAGKPLDKFLEQRVFKPLDMKDTGFYVPAEKLERFAANYTSDGNGKLTLLDAPAKSKYLKDPKFLSGGGGLVSTGRDYLRFLMMISRGGELDGARILSSKSVRQMTTNQLPASVGWIKFGGIVREGVGFGLGFSVREKATVWDPQGRLGEYGWGGAASTHYWVSPKDDLIVITLEQTMPYSFLTEFAVKGTIYDAIVAE